MLDVVNGLPAHPLLVHAPLVLIAMTLLLGAVYVLVPPIRPRTDWALLLLALASPVAAVLATVSGERLADRLGRSAAIDAHAHWGELTRNLSAVLALTVVLLVVVDRLRLRRSRRLRALAEGDDPDAPQRTVGGGVWTLLSVLLAILLLVVAGGTGTYLYLTGDSGAAMVWRNTVVAE